MWIKKRKKIKRVSTPLRNQKLILVSTQVSFNQILRSLIMRKEISALSLREKGMIVPLALVLCSDRAHNKMEAATEWVRLLWESLWSFAASPSKTNLEETK